MESEKSNSHWQTKIVNKLRIEGNSFNLIKNIYRIPTFNIILNGEKLGHFSPYNLEQGKDVHSYINDEKELAMQISEEEHSRQRKQQKWKRGSHVWGTERWTGSLVLSWMSSKVVGGKVIGVRRGPISQNLGSKVRNLNIILIALKSQRRVWSDLHSLADMNL